MERPAEPNKLTPARVRRGSVTTHLNGVPWVQTTRNDREQATQDGVGSATEVPDSDAGQDCAGLGEQKRLSEASVGAVAEGEVEVGAPVQQEGVGGGEACAVPAGSAEQHGHAVPGGDAHDGR